MSTHSSNVLALCWVLLLSVLLGAGAFYKSESNWDLIGYVASVYAKKTSNATALHELTYSDIEKSISQEDFIRLTKSPGYSSAIFNDSEALKQLVPFYSIRHVYVELISLAAASAGISVSQATFLISSIFGAASLIVVSLIFLHFKLSLAYLPFVVYPLGLFEISALASPDSLAAFFALLIYYLWLQPSRFLFGLSWLLCVILPLIRTDYVILSILVFGYSFSSKRGLSILGACLSLLVLVLGNKIAHGYSYLTLFNHQFIHLLPYPQFAELSGNPLDYIKHYLFGLRASFQSPQILLYVVASYYFFSKSRMVNIRNPNIGIPCLFFVLHMLLFPIFFQRHFVFSSVVIFIQLMLLVREGSATHHCRTPQT